MGNWIRSPQAGRGRSNKNNESSVWLDSSCTLAALQIFHLLALLSKDPPIFQEQFLLGLMQQQCITSPSMIWFSGVVSQNHGKHPVRLCAMPVCCLAGRCTQPPCNVEGCTEQAVLPVPRVGLLFGDNRGQHAWN